MNNFENQILEKISQNPIIVIYGPTWCGKTNLSLHIAKFLKNQEKNPFIISADSRQIYQEMNIGTGKILPHEMENIPHFWLNLISPTKTFSVVDFQKSIDNCPFFENWKQKKWNFVPIICGGTGLYIDSLIFERNYLGTKPNENLRNDLENFRLEKGNLALWEKLFALDPNYAHELHPNNHTYIIRAIEIFLETGKSKLESFSEKPKLKYPTIFLTPYIDSEKNRKNLYQSINLRIEKMFSGGLINEVAIIHEKYGDEIPGLKTIGYKEIMQFFHGEISETEAKNLIQQHNRNYAKRQITWNKKYHDFL